VIVFAALAAAFHEIASKDGGDFFNNPDEKY
jgi:hypothetical protein